MQHSLLIDIDCTNIESPIHSHDFHQLILPIHGDLRLEIEGKETPINNTKMAYVCASNQHTFLAIEQNKFILANIPSAWRNSISELPAIIKLTPTVKSYISFMSCQLQDLAVSALSQEQILAMLLDLISKPSNTSIQIDKRILLAKTFLDDHVATSVSLKQIAIAAHLSVRQLSQLFKEQLGVTPLNYLREQRMKQALILLTQSDFSITAIAESVGYQNLSAFSDRFNKHFGRSPRIYRHLDKQ